jgi:outer membrane receptor for ferrienterochelin and colicins
MIKCEISSFLLFLLASLCMNPFAVEAHADSTPPAINEELNLFQEIPSVYSASKYEQKVTEAPSSVSIITSSDIRIYGYRTLADILRSVRSFYVTYDRNYTFVGVRGYGRPQDYNSRIQLLIDGHRINDNLYDMAAIGTEAILDVDLIDRIEIIRGPGSSLYGSSAFFAVVNVITKRGRNLKGAEISAEAASYDTYKGRLSYGNRFQNGVEAIASGSAYDSKGRNLYYPEFDPASSTDPRATNNGIARNADYDRYQSFFSKLSYLDFTLEGAYNSRTKGISSGVFNSDFNNSGNKSVDKRGYLDLKFEHSLGSRTDVTARAYYDYYEYSGTYSSTVLLGAVNKDWAYADWWGSELKLTSRFFEMHRLIFGAEYLYNNRLDQMNYDIPFSVWLNDRRNSRVTAFYGQDEYTLIKNITVFAGLRYDRYNTFGGTVNPRLALVAVPHEKSVIKLLYGTAFRAPTPFELYYESPTNTANPSLKPEKIKTYELVYEQYLDDHFRAAATGFFYHIDGLINQTDASPGVTVYRNLEQVESHGFELEVENKWTNGVEGRFSYTVQRTTDIATGNVISNSPEHLAKFNLTLPLLRDILFAGVEEQYTGRRKTRSEAYENDFFITNLTITGRRIAGGFDLSASVYNLFDRKYSDPVSSDMMQQTILQDGRNYRLKITYAF